MFSGHLFPGTPLGGCFCIFLWTILLHKKVFMLKKWETSKRENYDSKCFGKNLWKWLEHLICWFTWSAMVIQAQIHGLREINYCVRHLTFHQPNANSQSWLNSSSGTLLINCNGRSPVNLQYIFRTTFPRNTKWMSECFERNKDRLLTSPAVM